MKKSIVILILVPLFDFAYLNAQSNISPLTGRDIYDNSFSDMPRDESGLRIVFYNVENLFDPFDDTLKLDDEYTILEDYVKIEHPNFKTYDWAGELVEGSLYGRNFFEKEGVVFERRELYAPKKIAADLNKIFGVSKLDKTGSEAFNYTVKKVTKYN